MTFRQGLVAARSHIVFIAGLLCASAMVMWLDQQASGFEQGPPNSTPGLIAELFPPLPLALHTELSEADMAAARTAWRYFVNNTNAKTGLVNAADQYPSTTMWDTGSYFIGLVAAHRLGIIDRSEVDKRLALALASLSRLTLFDGLIPNKAYDVRTLAMVDYHNTETERGIGWSALDMARLLISLKLIVSHYPEHAPKVSHLMGQWQLAALVDKGSLVGAAVDENGDTVLLQEGRIGYEQYGAKSFLLFGLDALQAVQLEPNVTYPLSETIPVPVDKRLVGEGPSLATSEPFILDGLEFGFDSFSHVLASNVYRAQEERFRVHQTLTAVSEGHLSKAPFFGYATVWGGGMPWAVMNVEGERFDDLRTLSTKAAFAWDALFGTPYTKQLVTSVADLADPAKGWLEGRYELDGTPNAVFTGNTNAVVLTSLAAKSFGPLLQMKPLVGSGK